MAFSPRIQGDLLPQFQFQWQDDLNNVVNISGQSMSNFTCIFDPAPGFDQPTVKRIVGTGVFSYVTDGTDGKINYAPVLADVNTPGQYIVYCQAILSSKQITCDPITLKINPAP